MMRRHELLRVQQGLLSNKLLTVEDAMEEIESLYGTVEELRKLRNNVVKAYDKYRQEDGRLEWIAMDNLMMVTSYIDYYIVKQGGEV